MQTTKILEFDNVSFNYETEKTLALKKLNFHIDHGEFVLLCGPTGSGKTSLIRTMNGLIPHFYRGQFYGFLKIKDIDSVKSSPPELAQMVGSVFQIPDNQLFATIVEKELAFGLEQMGIPREEIKKRIHKITSRLNLKSLLSRSPHELSSGEKQKVAIASILILNPEILILDEPLANLDPKNAQEIIQLLKSLYTEEKITIIIAEHRMQYLLPHSTKILLLDNGKQLSYNETDKELNKELLYFSGIDLPPLFYRFRELSKSNQNLLNLKKDFQNQIELMKELIQTAIKTNTGEVFQNKSKNPLEKRVEHLNFPLLSIQNLSFKYSGSKSSTNQLNNVSLNLYEQEIIGLLGPNGAGKTTLAKCILGLVQPQTGDIYLNSVNISHYPVYQRAERIGLIFQNPSHQLFERTVETELLFSLKSLKLSQSEKLVRIRETSEKLGITSLLDKSPQKISGGQRKLVSIAAVLIRDPKIIIFDEPTVGQDAFQKQKLKSIIRTFQNMQKTCLIISHDIDFISEIATRICIMKSGKIHAEGTPSDLLTNNSLLKDCSLEPSYFQKVYRGAIKDYPNLPQNIITVDQFEKEILK